MEYTAKHTKRPESALLLAELVRCRPVSNPAHHLVEEENARRSGAGTREQLADLQPGTGAPQQFTWAARFSPGARPCSACLAGRPACCCNKPCAMWACGAVHAWPPAAAAALTALSLSPTYLLSSSGPLMEMKLAPDSLATALATSVLPHPACGGLGARGGGGQSGVHARGVGLMGKQAKPCGRLSLCMPCMGLSCQRPAGTRHGGG